MLRPVTVSSATPPEVMISSSSGESSRMGTRVCTRSVLSNEVTNVDGFAGLDLDHVLVIIICCLGLLFPLVERFGRVKLLVELILLVLTHGEVLLPRGVLELTAGWRGAAAIVSVVPGIVSRAVIAGIVGIVGRVWFLVLLAALALGVAGLGIAGSGGE